MNRLAVAWWAAVVCSALSSCAGAAGSRQPDQSGPLKFGNDGGPPGNTYCSPLLDPGSKVGFADIITNPTRESAEIKAVELVDPVNLHFGSGRAWNVRKDGALYFWTEKVEQDKYSKGPLRAMRTAGGYVVEPGAEVGVAVPAEITGPDQDVTVGRILVRYTMGGQEYAEVSNTKYEMKPGGCGP